MALFEKRTVIHNEIDYDKLSNAISKQNHSEIDYDKLAEAIVKATKAEKAEEMTKHKETMEKFRGRYKIDENKKHSLINILRVFRAFFEYGEEQSDAPVMIFDLFKFLTGISFLLIEIITITFGLYMIGYTAFKDPNILDRIGKSIFGFSIVLIGSMFRIAKIEARVMEDKECINIVFSSIMALWGVIFAFIALFHK